MRTLICASLVASLMCASDARCDTLTWMIGVDQSEYELGEIVFWTASVNATDFSIPNFGLAVGQASLTEDRGETLSEANYALTPVNNYFPKFGGTGGAGFLNGFTAATFDSNAAIENVEDAVFTPFATGTFTTTVLGAYIDNYSRCLGGANAFYIENDGVLQAGRHDSSRRRPEGHTVGQSESRLVLCPTGRREQEQAG